MKFQLTFGEWTIVVFIACCLVLIGYTKLVRKPNSEVVPVFVEKTEEPLPIRLIEQVGPSITPVPRKLTPAQERLQKAGFDPFLVHSVSVK